MKILVTGAKGQIGSDLLATFIARGHEVIATDLVPPPAALGTETWLPLDVTKPETIERVFTEVKPDWVVHLAAILSATGEAHPQLCYEVNQNGTHNMLEASRRHGVKRFLFTSTIAVYGPGLPDPTPDDAALAPTTMYGVTKVAGELLCAYYDRKYGLDCRGVRFPGLISAALPGGGSSDYALFMYVDGIRRGHYAAFCRPDTRIPFMYMPDAVRALAELLHADKGTLRRTVYNIAAFSPRADEVAADVNRVMPGVAISYAPDPGRQGILDSWPKALDDRDAHADWGWKAQYDLQAMTDDLVPRIQAMF